LYSPFGYTGSAAAALRAAYLSLKYGPFVCFIQGEVELEQSPPAQE